MNAQLSSVHNKIMLVALPSPNHGNTNHGLGQLGNTGRERAHGSLHTQLLREQTNHIAQLILRNVASKAGISLKRAFVATGSNSMT